MNPAGCSASLVARFPVNPAPVLPHDPKGSSPGRWEAEGPSGRGAFSLRTHAQPGLPFPRASVSHQTPRFKAAAFQD